MNEKNYEVLNVEGGRHVKMWTHGVPVDEQAKQQLANIARMPFVHSHLAVMPDVHVGKGATVGSVIATKGAIIPAAVGVDIGCGMMAVQTTLKAQDLPESLASLRARIERAVPHGSVSVRGRAHKGSWGTTPDSVRTRWGALAERHDAIVAKYPRLKHEGAAQAARNAGRRQPLHRSLSRHRADRVGDVALGFARYRQHDRPALHRAGTQGHEEALHQPAGSGPRVPGRGNGSLRRLRRGDDLGPGLRGREPPFDDGRGAARDAGGAACVPAGRGGGELPPQLLHARDALRRGPHRDPQGRGEREEGRARNHPGIDGCAFFHRSRPGKSRELRELSATARVA